MGGEAAKCLNRLTCPHPGHPAEDGPGRVGDGAPVLLWGEPCPAPLSHYRTDNGHSGQYSLVGEYQGSNSMENGLHEETVSTSIHSNISLKNPTGSISMLESESRPT